MESRFSATATTFYVLTCLLRFIRFFVISVTERAIGHRIPCEDLLSEMLLPPTTYYISIVSILSIECCEKDLIRLVVNKRNTFIRMAFVYMQTCIFLLQRNNQAYCNAKEKGRCERMLLSSQLLASLDAVACAVHDTSACILLNFPGAHEWRNKRQIVH